MDFLYVIDRIVKAHEAINHPAGNDGLMGSTLTWTHLFNLGICFVVAFCIIAMFHFTIGVRFKEQYFAVHVFANSVITWLSYECAFRALLNPASSTLPVDGRNTSYMYLIWIYALHVYHPIFFKTGRMDWIHHAPVYTLIFMFTTLAGDVFHLHGLVLTGIPGGIDYILLVMVGEGWLTRSRYKHISAAINNWIRAPLGFLTGYITIVGLINQLHLVTYWGQIPTFFGWGVHACWNAPYFGRQAVEANIVDTVNRMHDLNLKLPKVRAMSGVENPNSVATGKGSKRD